MLDFLLVLGQVPGTNYEISFWQIVSACLLMAIVIMSYRYYRRRVFSSLKTLRAQILLANKHKIARISFK